IMPQATQEARKKAQETADNNKRYAYDDLKEPVPSLKAMNEVIDIYPLPSALLRRAYLKYDANDRNGAIQDASLAAAMSSLEIYQTRLMPQEFLRTSWPMAVGRRFVTQLQTLDKGQTTPALDQVDIYEKAVRNKQWLVADAMHQENAH